MKKKNYGNKNVTWRICHTKGFFHVFYCSGYEFENDSEDGNDDNE